MIDYLTNDTELTSIADTIRSINLETEQLKYPEEFIKGIKQIPMMPSTVFKNTVASGPWVRPNDWPNLDNLTVGQDEQVIYLTYDARKTPGYGWIGLYFQLASDGNIVLTRGHIENNEFVGEQDYVYPTSSWYTYIRRNLDTTYGDVQLYKVTATKNITYFAFTANGTDNNTNQYNTLQPCVERKGRLDYSTIVNNGPDYAFSSKKHTTIWLEKDALIMASKFKLTNLAYAWSDAVNLHEINFDEWDTSMWEITNMRNMFYNCQNLLEVDTTNWHTENWKINQSFTSVFYNCYSLKRIIGIEDWDTSQWTIPNMESTWYYCSSLESLDLNGWDTSKWTVEYFTSVWAGCFNLKELKISDWDVSNWRGGTITSCWNCCYKLTELDIANWDVSKWAIRSLASTWSYCTSLVKLDLSKWDTSNWVVTSLSTAWGYCRSLRELKIDTWDTSNWAVTTLYYAWTYCHSLKELKLNNWDTSNWAVTTLEHAWSYTYSLETLEIEDWDTSNWAVTAFNSVWYNAQSIHVLDLSGWNTSNWAVTSLAYTWCSAFSLEEINLDDWDTSNWTVTSIAYMFQSCYSLKSLDISHFITTNWNLSNVSYAVRGVSTIIDVKLPSIIKCAANITSSSQPAPESFKLRNFTGLPIPVNQSYSSDYSLTIASLLNIINALPTVTSTKTLTLGAYNKRKLTAEQIAIATNKGWTVA